MSYFIIQEDGSVISSYDVALPEVLNVNPDSVCGQAAQALDQSIQQQNNAEGE